MRRSSSARRRGETPADRWSTSTSPRRRRPERYARTRLGGGVRRPCSRSSSDAVGASAKRRVLYETGRTSTSRSSPCRLDRWRSRRAAARPRLPRARRQIGLEPRLPRLCHASSLSRADAGELTSSRATSGTTRSGREEAPPWRGVHGTRCLTVHEGRLVTLLGGTRGRSIPPSTRGTRALSRALGRSGRAGRARARVRPLRPARRRPGAVGDDRPLPGHRGGDGAAARARGRARPADLRRRIAEVVPDPRHGATLWP